MSFFLTDDSTVVQSVYSSDSNSPSDTKRSKVFLLFMVTLNKAFNTI